jgi:putative ABC transport system permease protein
MDLLPILATLKRHKTAAGLIVLQVALTCAIVCNALFLISQRLERINEPSGLADDELVVVSVVGVGPSQNPDAQTRADLQALRAVPGVQQLSVINQLPFGHSFSMSTMRTQADRNAPGVGVASYNASEGWLQALGLRLVAGRDFEAAEYQDASTLEQSENGKVTALVINKALAERLFPGADAVGQTLYGISDEPTRIVGVVERLVTPHPGGSDDMNIYSMLLPVRESFRGGAYVLRTEPGRREAVLKAAIAALDQSGPGRILRQQQLFSEMRSGYYAQDRNMVHLLVGVCLALMVVTAFGIVGLASFWVQQRTRMIGTRRALGATRGQILRYFQAENLLLSGVGIVIGMLAAYGISLLLMQNYEMPRLPWSYLPVGALVLCALGQLAVLAPARRAAALPPVAALRS